jgi:iron complex transport system substrate-binding protein
MPHPRPFPRALTGALLAIAVLVGACSSSGASQAPSAAPSEAAASATPAPTAAPTTGPTPTPAPAFPATLTDDEGTAVTIPAEPQKIVSLTPAATELLFKIGAGDRVVAKVEDVADFPPEAHDLPVVATYQGVDTEKIVGLGADLVIAGGNFGTAPDAIAKLRSLGIPVLVVYAPTIDGALKDIELIGSAVGQPDAARDLTASMRAGMDQVSTAVGSLPAPRVFYETGTDPSGTVYGIADDSVYEQLIRLAGGEPITTGSAQDWAQSTESLVAADPQIILLGDGAYGMTADAVAARPGWKALTAVKDGAVKPVDDIVVTRPGPRLVDGLLVLAKALHPDAVLPSLAPAAP